MISLTLSPQLGQDLRRQGETSDLAYTLSELAVWLSPTETVGGDTYHYRLELDAWQLRDIWHAAADEIPAGPAAVVLTMLPARPSWLDMGEGSDIGICGDCLFLLANGTTEGLDVHYWAGVADPDYAPDYRREPSDEIRAAAESAFLAAVEDEPGWMVDLGSSDCEYCGSEIRAAGDATGDEITECEGWFAHSACDLCGCHLGGDRYHAHSYPAKVDA